MQPKGILLDFGGVLVEEVSFDPRAGNEWLLTRATHRPAGVTIDDILDRAMRVTSETAARRDEYNIETQWPMLTRLIYDKFGIRVADAMPDLELGFWKASVVTRPMQGARAALQMFRDAGVPIAVLSNASFGEHVVQYEIARHGLSEHLEFVMVSSEYCVRKPNVLLFEVAAARLGVQAKDVWFVGDRLDADVVGSKAAGMTAVWFGQHNLHESLLAGADLTVANWHELTREFAKHTKIQSNAVETAAQQPI